jgi:hypothetical protein
MPGTNRCLAPQKRRVIGPRVPAPAPSRLMRVAPARLAARRRRSRRSGPAPSVCRPPALANRVRPQSRKARIAADDVYHTQRLALEPVSAAASMGIGGQHPPQRASMPRSATVLRRGAERELHVVPGFDAKALALRSKPGVDGEQKRVRVVVAEELGKSGYKGVPTRLGRGTAVTTDGRANLLNRFSDQSRPHVGDLLVAEGNELLAVSHQSLVVPHGRGTDALPASFDVNVRPEVEWWDRGSPLAPQPPQGAELTLCSAPDSGNRLVHQLGKCNSGLINHRAGSAHPAVDNYLSRSHPNSNDVARSRGHASSFTGGQARPRLRDVIAEITAVERPRGRWPQRGAASDPSALADRELAPSALPRNLAPPVVSRRGRDPPSPAGRQLRTSTSG